MTVKEYLRGIQSSNLTSVTPGGPSFLDAMQDTAEIWSNNACAGYFL